MAQPRISIEVHSDVFARRIATFLRQTDQDTRHTLAFIALRVRSSIIRRTPVGATHRLQRGWKAPVQVDQFTMKITTSVPYAPILEYGGYPGVGPKTAALSARELGHGLRAEAGIYSLQAPHGMVRRGLAENAGYLLEEIRTSHQRRWGRT